MLQLSLSDLDKPPSGSQQESQTLLAEIRRAVQASQRCIVITGAGISVSSGIPDFRSPDGLFQQLKQKYPNSVSTGKDLFDATLFSDPAMISLFYNFMGELRNLVSRANCTPTHAFIKELDEAGKLLRCYTQNIDSLEKRIGLETSLHASPEDSSDTPCSSPPSLISDCSSLDTDTIDEKKSQAAKRRTHRRRQMTLERTFTRAVQLHGDLDNVVCTICHTKYPFTEKLAEEFCEGAPPPCPRCKEIEMIRDLVGKRSVASGVLRPDIVLYNENHPQSELIGALSEYDLKRRPDLLIVIGTSLKIPGIKRMVKEMAHSVHACTLRSKRAGAGKVIFINRDEPPKGWESIFDYYVAGDSDRAISLLPIAGLPEPPPVQQPAVQRQRAPRVAKPVKTSSKISLSSLLAPAKSRVGTARKLAASGAVAKPIRAPRKLTSMMRVVKSPAVVKREQKALPQKHLYAPSGHQHGTALGDNHAEIVPDSYIVILKDNTKSGQSLLQGHLALLTSTIREANARAPSLKDANQIRHIYDEGIFGYSGKFEPEILECIRRSEIVAFVEKDATVHVPEAPPDPMHTVSNKAQK